MNLRKLLGLKTHPTYRFVMKVDLDGSALYSTEEVNSWFGFFPYYTYVSSSISADREKAYEIYHKACLKLENPKSRIFILAESEL